MKRIAFLVCLATWLCTATPPAQAQCPARTTIADTIYNGDGSLASGRVVIAWPTYTIGSCQVVAGQTSVNVVNGAFTVDLYPNATAVPAGTSYRVTYYLKSGRITTEYWVVPASGSPVSIASVRSASVPVPTVMFSQSQVTNLLPDLAKKLELPAPCPAGKYLQSNGSPAQPQVNCVDGTSGSGGGSQHQVNSANLLSNDPVNFQNTATVAFSNPSAGVVQASVPDASTAAKGVVEMAANGESAASLAVQANDSRLSDARSPTAHAASHQHGGSDPVASATPGANAIPKADAGGKLADGWLSTNVSLLGSAIDLSSEVTGALPDASLGGSYSGTGSCSNTFVRTTNRNAAPTCATVQKSDAAGTFVHTDQTNTYSAGQKQSFAPDSTSAGINIGALAGDPSTGANGDIWYNSSTHKFRCRENGTSKDCIPAGGGSSPLTAKGDIHTYDSADARLPAGANYQVLKADSAQATGLKWIDAPTVLDRSTSENDIVNTSTETSLYSLTVPAGALGTDKIVNLLILGDVNNSSGSTDTVTLRVKWAGTTVYQDNANVTSSSGLRAVRLELSLANLGAANAQFLQGHLEISIQNNATTGFGDLNNTGAAVRQLFGTTTGMSADTSSAQTLEITVQHSVANANTSFRRKYAFALLQ